MQEDLREILNSVVTNIHVLRKMHFFINGDIDKIKPHRINR